MILDHFVLARILLGLDIDNVRIDDDSNVRSVRQSRRIAQIKIREQVENKYGEPMSPADKESGQKGKSVGAQIFPFKFCNNDKIPNKITNDLGIK